MLMHFHANILDLKFRAEFIQALTFLDSVSTGPILYLLSQTYSCIYVALKVQCVGLLCFFSL